MDAISFKEVSKLYPSGKRAVNQVSFSMGEGEFLGLLGLNGAGKTTLIRLLTGLISPSSGSISLFHLGNTASFQARRKLFGFSPQEINFSPFETLEDMLVFYGYLSGLRKSETMKRTDFLLDALSLSDKRKAKLGALSGGMKRRAMLARALLSRPPLLILDEPSAGLDLATRNRVWDLLRTLQKEGTSILLTSHYLEEIESLCDHVALMHAGTVLIKDRLSVLKKPKPSKKEWIFRVMPKDPRERPLLPENFHQEGEGTLLYRSEGLPDLGLLFNQLDHLGYEVLGAKQREYRLKDLLQDFIPGFSGTL